MEVEHQQLSRQRESCILAHNSRLLRVLELMEEESRSNLNRLHELPDASQELFIETWRNTATFHPFPRLPVELRLAIWRNTFPESREVDVGLLNYYASLSDAKHLELRRLFEPLPITLAVTLESREETLKYFCVCLRYNSCFPDLRTSVKPLVFNPSKDQIFLHFDDIYRMYGLEDHLISLRQRWPQHVSKATKLIVKGINLDKILDHSLISEEENFWENSNGDLLHDGFMLHFSAIQELTLCFYTPAMPLAPEMSAMQKIEQDLRDVLDYRTAKFESGKPPKVNGKFHCGSRLRRSNRSQHRKYGLLVHLGSSTKT